MHLKLLTSRKLRKLSKLSTCCNLTVDLQQLSHARPYDGAARVGIAAR
jgi:hypothetical protein